MKNPSTRLKASKLMENIEIEIQVKVENSKALLDFLEKNAKFEKESQQVDVYYSPSHRDFIAVRPVKEWLRIRNSGGKCFITYKNFHYDSNQKSAYADEYELSVEGPEKLEKIFDALNFKEVARVDKIRKCYNYENWEIALDSVKGLGDFVEVEYKGDEPVDPKAEAQKMVKFLRDVGCGKVERNYVGYPFMIMFPNEVKFQEE